MSTVTPGVYVPGSWWSGRLVLRVGFGVLFLWLGLLKVVPGISPAEPLMRAAMPAFLPIDAFIRFAAVWEIIVGIGFLTGRMPLLTLAMTFATMCTTLSIPWLAPGLVWRDFPVILTFDGEYVAKDVVITTAALVLAAAVALEVPSIGFPWRHRVEWLLERSVAWLQRHSMLLLRLAYAAVFIEFGVLKLVPGASELESLVHSIVPIEHFDVVYAGLGVFEIAVGLALATGRWQRVAVALSIVFLVITALPFFSRPDLMFQARPVPLLLTLEGQHVLKNAVFLGAALVLLRAPVRSRRVGGD